MLSGLSSGILLAAGLAAVASGASPGPLQDGREPIPEVDPYTRGDERAMAKAGYVSFGPFRFGDGHSSEQLAESLGGVPVIFVETAHFRIASSLETLKLGEDPLERDQLEAELKQLKRRLPRVKPKQRELDPWLRLHLFAQRCEQLYSDLFEAFELDPDLFPAVAPARKPGEPFELGAGPHLGLHEKFAVLLTQKTSSLARYSAVYLDRSVSTPYRFYFADRDCFLYCTSFELMGDVYGNEVAFRCAVTYGLSQNLINAFGGYTHSAPLWFRHGVARWFTRRIDPRWMVYAFGNEELGRTEDDADWPEKVRARVANDYYPSFAETLEWSDEQALRFADHMVLWSRIDWMLAEEPARAGQFLREALAAIPWGERQDRPALERAQCERALAAAFGSVEGVDEAWRAWVLKHYPR